MSDPTTTRTIAVQVDCDGRSPENIDEFTLTPVSGDALPAWTAGLISTWHYPGGIVRQYSLCLSADDLSNYRVVNAAPTAAAVRHRSTSGSSPPATTDIGAPAQSLSATRRWSTYSSPAASASPRILRDRSRRTCRPAGG